MTDQPTLSELSDDGGFAARHIGPSIEERRRMLEVLGYASVDELLTAALPPGLAELAALDLPPAAGEVAVTAELRELAGRNRVMTQMIGAGFSDTVTPPVIRRNVLENPAWYTAYTPYQPEISQGRLEALLAFQTAVADLTGLPIANASLLDEASAAAEAMTLCRRAGKVGGDVFAVDTDTHPQTLAVLRTRAEPLGITLYPLDSTAADQSDQGTPELPEGTFGVLLQYPGTSGAVRDQAPLIAAAHQRGAVVAVAADLLALALLRPPGEAGADIAIGSAQRFGVPLGCGGPHAAYIAVRADLARLLPGRLVGVSKDAGGAPAYRLALQTREQHIRREKATSNICTAQVLLAVVAGLYAVWHGPAGLRRIATRTHRMAAVLAAGLRAGGVEVVHDEFFDTVLVRVPGTAERVLAAAADRGVNLRLVDGDLVAIATDEVTVARHLELVWAAFGAALSRPVPTGRDLIELDTATGDALPEGLLRRSGFLGHPTFCTHRSETSMLRYLRRLADADYALDRGMIPLGSCTMKLNATTEMEPISWPEFAGIHPYAPAEQRAGYAELVSRLEGWLAVITGYDTVSIQPNAGSQGELSGLLAIRGYHRSRGEAHRDVCLVPSSAHGTNAASAVLAGMRVVAVRTEPTAGSVDLDDLRAKIVEHGARLAALMITYPSTHGVYEDTVTAVCAQVHDAGGQVYVDGANLNALVGLARPGRFGADVSHLNLHKTFCIPHGGGGPGVGPVAVRAHLAEHLPGDPLTGSHAVTATQWGSAGVLPIPYAYIRLMGPDGLREATATAVLSANYLAARLRDDFPVLYAGAGGLVAHECVLDLRPITKATGVTVDDVAKRLIDYGFHAPTMSFPVPGTLMVEPTESEDLAELDRFVAAMTSIRSEVDRVAAGEWPTADNPVRNAPHTAAMLASEWDHPYPRELAAHPAPGPKYWPPVRRIDGAYGDRNLFCSCPPVDG
jgi:glycine dehydrogenase